MDIAVASEGDIAGIISLMRSSLGEDLMPKSEDFFRWKHYENPFGKSKILLAKEGSGLVGLRAFMRWKWSSKNHVISAMRAVDTATDPEYQGRGIFSKLTMQAVEECKKEGVEMVFNTPNSISIKGYLKMGWNEVGKMPLFFSAGSIFPFFFSESLSAEILSEFNISEKLSSFDNNWSLSTLSDFYYTPISFEFLTWRYKNCPIIKYGMISEGGEFGIIFRIKPFNRFIELRICEIWASSEGTSQKKIRDSIKTLIKKIRPLFVSCTYSPMLNNKHHSLPGLFGPFYKGPIVTIRSLCLEDLDNFINFKNWQPSIGSMELF